MTAIPSGIAAVSPLLRVEGRPDGAVAATLSGDTATAAVDPIEQKTIDPVQLAMLPERFWPYDVWLRAQAWTHEPEPSADNAVPSISASEGLRAYRDATALTAEKPSTPREPTPDPAPVPADHAEAAASPSQSPPSPHHD